MKQQLTALVPRLAHHRIIVIGDLILDEYLTGTATRMSREAPIPVLEFESRRLIPGGAANPAANIAALGGYALQVGVTGSDQFAESLTNLLSERGIDTGGVLIDPGRPTTVKTRVMAHMGLRFPQQVARLDRLSREPISQDIEQRLVDTVGREQSSSQAILFSDYHGGLITPSLIETIRVQAKNAILSADAQGEFDKYREFTVVKCNADEARTYLRRPLTTNADYESAALDLCRTLGLTGAMVITRGADGATLATATGETVHCPAPAVTDVYDTVGAGDTAVAVLTLAVCAGASYVDAAALATYASGIVVRRVGNYAPSPEELIAAIR